MQTIAVLVIILTISAMHISRMDLEKLCDHHDDNNDGSISLNEFNEMMKDEKAMNLNFKQELEFHPSGNTYIYTYIHIYIYVFIYVFVYA